jgi:hypothetical protein
MSWYSACAKVEPYIVKIETPAGAGTGFFFAYNEDKSLVGIATALHVVSEAQNWRYPIKIVQGAKELFLTYEDRAVIVDNQRDSAAILVAAAACKSKEIAIPDKMLPLLASDKKAKVGVTLGWAGFPAIASRKLCFFQGGVSAFNPHDDSYFIDGVAINGVSGGPVFDEDEPLFVVGIVSAYYINRQRGEALPGLSLVHDVTHLNTTIEQLRTRDEARKKEQEPRKAKEAEPVQPGPPEPTPKPVQPGPAEPIPKPVQPGPTEPTPKV